VVGIAAIFSDDLIQIGGQPLTANIVTMSVFGAIVMYIVSMLALFKLRRSRDLARPFSARPIRCWPGAGLRRGLPGGHDLVQPAAGADFAGSLAVAYAYYLLTHRQRAAAASDVLLEGSDAARLKPAVASSK
jgi:ethanolamine permease